jgi:hypothetical protein
MSDKSKSAKLHAEEKKPIRFSSSRPEATKGGSDKRKILALDEKARHQV